MMAARPAMQTGRRHRVRTRRVLLPAAAGDGCAKPLPNLPEHCR